MTDCLTWRGSWAQLIQMFNEELPGYKRGYLYMALSFVLAWAFGILIYGTAHWVM